MPKENLSNQKSAALSEKSAQQLRSIFDGINGGVSVVVYEKSGKVSLAYANARYYEIFGYTQEQFTAELKTAHDALYPEDAEYAGAMIESLKLTREPVTFKYRIVKRDGSIAWVQCNSSVAAVEGLGETVLISVLTDITASVEAEQQTLVLGHRLDTIMKNISNAVTAVVFENDGAVEFLFSNELYHEMLGYTKEQYRNEVSDPFRLVHPDDAQDVRSAVTEACHVGDTKKLQYRVICRDGQIKWLRAKITVMSFPDKNKPVQLAVYTDVTDMVEANARLAKQRDQISEMVNAAPSGIAVIEVDPRDIEGSQKTIYYNDRFFSFSGYSHEEYDALLQRNQLYFAFEEDIPALIDFTTKICGGNIGDSEDIPVRCRTKEGGFRWLLLTGLLVEKQADRCIISVSQVDITERKKAIDRQRINEEILRIAVETDKRSIILYDVKANTCRVESRNLFSVKYGEVIENIPESLVERGVAEPESVSALLSLFDRIRQGEKQVTASLQLHTGTDEYQWFECNATVVFDANGNPDHAVIVFHNITEQRVKEAVFKKWQQSIETRPKDSYTLFRCNLSKDASLDERDGNLLKIEFDAASMSFNARTKECVEQLVYPEDREAYSTLLNSNNLLSMFYRGEHAAELEYREIEENGEICWRKLTVEMVEYLNSTDVQAFLMYEDINEEKTKEIKAREMAETDPLTGALNRAAFSERVDKYLEPTPAAQQAMMMLDLDGFKMVNDTFGHAAGDQALLDITAVIRSLLDDDDLICRLGGDEFLIFLHDIPYDAAIEKRAKKICELTRKAFSQEVQISTSIGIAVYPRDGHNFDELYHRADNALYRVKNTGKNSFVFFSASESAQADGEDEALLPKPEAMRAISKSKRRMLIVDNSDLNRSMLSGLFKDDFQIELARGGAEAMIRLRHFGASISIVLLGLDMPGMSGYEVLKRMQNNAEMQLIPVIAISAEDDAKASLKAIELGATDYVTEPIDLNLVRLRVQSAISKAENERLRAQNSYLQLQRDEELKFHIVLESTGTVVVEYNWRNHVFIYDGTITKYIAGEYNNRSLWTVLLSDMVADSADVKGMQNALLDLANDKDKTEASRLVRLMTPAKEKHWFRMNIYKKADEFGLAEKMILTFNDVHEEVLADEKLHYRATRDVLTGLYNRAGFIEEAAAMIASKAPGYYVMSCIDIEKFRVINDQYGTEKGDHVLCEFANVLTGLHHDEDGICARVTADNFVVLFPQALVDSDRLEVAHAAAAKLDGSVPPLRFYVGRCMVEDKELGVSAIYDRAMMAKDTIKGRYDSYIGTYDEAMRLRILKQQSIIGQMKTALESGQFETWLQPQYDHVTGKLSGAEALVRWRHPKDGIIPPNEFIPVFEKNGFIYELDKYVWECTCQYLHKWRLQGQNPVPVSVNVSRYDVFREDFVDVITGLVKKYDLPADLLRLEITESAFSESYEQIISVVKHFVELGFVVEIDDFGSGYSSLNTLKDVPAQVLKMDMRFLENSGDLERGGNIIESVIRMAQWLDMTVIAEGVETLAQADYLASIGCEYVQGYLYSRPMQVEEYEKLLAEGNTESKPGKLQTVETWNNSAFWNPESMESLIFNSYVGGACIFEYHNGKTELLRTNHAFYRELGTLVSAGDRLSKEDFTNLLDDENHALLHETVRKAATDKTEIACELNMTRGEETEYIRITIRLIAVAADRLLFYGVIQNMTEQRVAEQKQSESAKKLEIIMGNINGGVSAILIDDSGTSKFVFNNEKYYELYGYTREEAIAEKLDVMSLILPEDLPSVMEMIHQLKKNKQPTLIDYRIRKKDGSLALLRANASLMSIEGYGDEVITSVLMDITEQQELNDKFRAVVDNINGGVSATFLRGDRPEYVIVNDRYYDIIGYTKEQFKAEVSNAFDLIHPDDRERVKEQFKEATRRRGQYSMEYRLVRRDGTIRNILCNTNVIRLFGIEEPVQLAVSNDITELHTAQRKEIEAAGKLRAVLNHAGNGITAIALRGEKPEFLIANDRYFEIIGYTREEYAAATAKDMFAPIYDADKERIREIVISANSKHGSVTVEFRVKRKNGALVWVHSDITITELPGIDVPVQIAVFSDITEEKESSDQLRFLNSSAHEILAQSDSNLAVKDMLQKLMTYFGAGRGYVVELDYAKKQTFNTYEVCAAGVTAEIDNLQALPFSEKDYWYEKLSCDKYFLLEDVSDFPENETALRKLLAAQGIRTLILAPIWRDGILHGFVGVDNPTRAMRQISRLTAMSDYIAILLNRRDLSRNVQNIQLELLDNLPQGAALYRYDGKKIAVIHINKRYWELVDRPAADYSSASVVDVIYPDDRILLEQEIRSAISQNRALSVHVRIMCGSGEYKPFHITANFTQEEDGSYLFYTSYSAISGHTMSVQELITVSLSTMLATSSDIAYLKDRDLRYVSCSQALADMVGAPSPQEVIGKTADDFFEKKYADQFNAEDARIIALGKSVVDAVETVPAGDGSTRLASTSKYPIIDADGNVYGVYCVSRDVTALRQAQSQLELLTSTIPGGIAAYSVTKDGVKTLYFNDGYYDFSGYTREEYVAMTAKEPLALMLEEDRPIFLATLREIIGKQADGATASCIYRCNTKAGELRWMSMSMGLAAMGDGQFVLNAVQLDVTEQKSADEKQIELLDNLPCGAALYEFDGTNLTTIHLNHRYELLTGRQVNSGNTGRLPIEYIHPDDRKPVMDEVKSAIAENRNGVCDIRVLYGESEYRSFHIDARIEKKQGGKYLLYVTYIHIPEHTLSLREMLPVALSAIMKTSPDMAFVKDVDRRYLCASPSAVAVTGCHSEAEILGKTDYELFGKELGDKYARDDSRVLKSGQSIINDRDVIPTADGIVHEILTSKYPIMDTTGAVVGLYGISRDITQLRKNESQLKLLSNSIPGGIASFEFDPDGLTALYFNDGFYRSSGYSPEQYAALTAEDTLALIHEEDRPKLLQLMREQAKDKDVKSVMECDCRCRLQNGSYRWYSIRGSISNVEKDRFTINAALFDIDKRVRAEKALAEQRKELAALISSTPGGIIKYSADTDEFAFISDTMYSMLGYTPEEFFEKFHNRFSEMIWHEDRKKVLEKIVEDIRRTGTHDSCEYHIETKGGALKWVLDAGYLYTDETGERWFVVVIVDNDERKEAEERLRVSEEENRLAIEHSGNIIARFDVKTRTLTLPERFNEIFTIPRVLHNLPQEQIALGSVSPETADAYAELFEGIVRGNAEGSVTFQQISTVGWRWLEAQYTTVFESSGKPASAVITFSDVTERLEKDALYKKWQQSMSERPEDTFTMLRFNLSRSTYSSWEGKLLKIDFGDAETFDEHTAAYISQYVCEEDRESFAAFLRAESLLAQYYRGTKTKKMEYRERTADGGERWVKITVDLVEYPGSKDVEAFMLFEDIDERKRDELNTRRMAELDPLTGLLNRATFSSAVDKLIADADREEQHAFFMLDIDGFKRLNDTFGHAAGDEALIEVANKLQGLLRRGDLLGRLGGDEFVIFLSSISGAGSIEKKAQQVCSALFKTYSTEVYISTSIGIAIYPQDGRDCYTLYNNADMALYAAKENGRNTFVFYNNKMSAKRENAAAEEGGSAGKLLSTYVKRRMLIVDDNEMDRRILANLFEQEFTVDFALDGASALSRMRYYGSALSIVLLDLYMQGMNGFEILERTRDTPEMRNVPIVVVSSDDDRETSLRAIRLGAADFINKPVEPELIRLRVDAAVSRAENERLRAQNSHLAFVGNTTARYQAALSQLGMSVIELDWIKGSFVYDSSLSQYLKGNYDGRTLWRILLSDMVAESMDVQKMQTFIHNLAEDRKRNSDSMKVQLRTPSNAKHWFSLNVVKLSNDAGLTEKLVLTFQDIDESLKH